MKYETIRYSPIDAIGIIELNRPERMNAVTEKMYKEIQEILDSTSLDPDVRAIILTGSVLKKSSGEIQAFCAGADLKDHAAGKRTPAQRRDYILLAQETTRRIYDFPKPVIAAVNGPARGAGSEMALNCDFIFMADTASIAFPETGLGTFVGGGATYHLPRLVGLAKAKEIIYSGKVLYGKAAVEFGLALNSFPVERLLDESIAFAQMLTEKAPISMQHAKMILQGGLHLDIDPVVRLEAEAILSCMETSDWHEGIRSFKEKRKPVYRGR
ncbi:MAG: enoyl-CoA hydratase/isomerase family protein [Deltaproteobacteria bacterium]|nr:enoyl-CoA hydratase/isomerase family protein [Deltaproteobacteria bacterium]